MIAKLSGRVDHIKENFLILDVQGVGYKVFCSQKNLSHVNVSDTLVLYIETIVREDAFLLYGFMRESEQAWFVLLTTVQGVGARVALAILSVCQEDALAQAILSQDTAYMTQAEGVGPKLATRIVHELKNKVETILPASLGTVSSCLPSKLPVFEDAVSALVNLGYRRLDVVATLQKLSSDQESSSVDALIRQGLKILSEGRR